MLIKMEDGEKIIENNIIGLVTARGGSTRLPRKNILSFCGHPLVAWSIMQLRCSKYINDVYLTTDDEEIAEIGEQYGAKIIMREVLNNDISAGYVLKLAVEELEKNNIKIDQIFYSLPTSPLKKINDVDSIIDSFNFINNFINAGEIKPVAIEKECYIYQNIMRSPLGVSKPFHIKSVIKNKSYNYSRFIGGWGFGTKDHLIKFWNEESKFDSEIDGNLEKDLRKVELAHNIEPWQCFETDYLDYFKLCELIMENFILQGKGMDVYTDYAKKFNKEIEFINSKQFNLDLDLDYNKYIGNIKQI